MSKTYNSSSIKSLGIVGGVRKRFSMYIDATGSMGILKLLYEIISNACDEAKDGHGNKILIKISDKHNYFEVEDFGRGIPLCPDNEKDKKSTSTLDQILLEIHSGGKFDQSNYNFSTGRNGAGLFLCNCLSVKMTVEVKRDGRHVIAHYKKGFKDKVEELPCKDKSTGTKITFEPDIDVLFGPDSDTEFTGTHIEKEKVLDLLDLLSHVIPGVEFALNFDGHIYKFLFKGQVSDYLKETLIKKKKHSMIDNFFVLDNLDSSGKMKVRMAVTFIKDQNEEFYLSYMNDFPTPKGGTHISGVKKAISRVITNYIKKNKYVSDNAKFQATGANIIDNIFGIIISNMENPLYSNQTKECLTSSNYELYISTVVYQAFTTWADNHVNEMDKICKFAVLKAKADYAAKEAREVTMDASSTKNLLQSKTVDLKKFTDCSGNNPKENEIFLVEGDSAGGSVSQARDSKTQAFLRLRGKILNVLNNKGKLSPELEALITVLGIGFGNKKNISRLKYHKIVAMCDADADGGHIVSLLILFFYTYYPELIENGNLYVAMPPLYGLTFKNKQKIYLLNETFFNIFKRNAALFLFDLVDIKGKILPKGLFELYLSNLIGFNDFMNNYSIELNLDPVLLELIIRSFKDLINGKYKQFEKFGYITKQKERSKHNVVFEFDKDFIHSYLNIDSKFYNNIYVPIYIRLSQIYLGNVQLKTKKDNKIYKGTSYELSKVIESVIMNKSVRVTRYKGLGELNQDELSETCMNPKTRKLIKVTMENAKEADKWLNGLMGSGNENIKFRKDFFLS